MKAGVVVTMLGLALVAAVAAAVRSPVVDVASVPQAGLNAPP